MKTFIILGIIILYLVVLFGVCTYMTILGKKQIAAKGEEDNSGHFLMAGQNLPLFLVAFMMAGNCIGSTFTIGIAELGYSAGLSAAMYGIAGIIAICILGIVGAKRMRQSGCATSPQLVGKFCGQRAEYMVVLGTLLNSLCIICLQYRSGSTMLHTMFPNVSVPICMAICGAAFLVLGLIGGLFGASVANVVNLIVIYGTLITCFVVAINNAGGFQNLITSVENLGISTDAGGEWFTLTGGVGIMTVLSYFISEIPNRFSIQSDTQCVFAGKDVNAARWGVVLGAVIAVPLALMSAVFGMIALVFNADGTLVVESATSALPALIISMSPVLAGLGMAGLWACNISTAVALLMAVMQIIMVNLFMPSIGRKLCKRPKDEVVWSRIIMVIVVVATLIISYFLGGMVSAIITVQCVIPSFFLIILSSLFHPGFLRRHTAEITMGVCYAFFIIWLIFLRNIIAEPVYVEWPLAFVSFVLVSLIEKKPAHGVTLP